jgi:hypothetical protein
MTAVQSNGCPLPFFPCSPSQARLPLYRTPESLTLITLVQTAVESQRDLGIVQHTTTCPLTSKLSLLLSFCLDRGHLIERFLCLVRLCKPCDLRAATTLKTRDRLPQVGERPYQQSLHPASCTTWYFRRDQEVSIYLSRETAWHRWNSISCYALLRLRHGSSRESF